MSRMPRHLMEHPEDLSIVRLPGGAEPDFDWTPGPFASMTRTPDETSIVCLTANVPAGARTERVAVYEVQKDGTTLTTTSSPTAARSEARRVGGSVRVSSRVVETASAQ